MTKVVVNLPDAAPTAEKMLARIHELAKDTSNIVMNHPHVRQRFLEREINTRQVLEVLRKGTVLSGPTRDEHGDLRLEIKRFAAGRKAQIVVDAKCDHLVTITAIQRGEGS